MLSLFVLRLISVGIVLLVSKFTHQYFFVGVILLGLTHYGTAFIYSRKTAGRLLSRRRTFLLFIFLTGMVAAITYWQWPPMILFFGIHHVLSEIYTPSGVHPSLDVFHHSLKTYTPLRVLFHSLSYVLMTRLFFPIPYVQSNTALLTLLWGFVLTSLWYFYSIYEAGAESGIAPELRKKAVWDLILSESLFLIGGLISYFRPIGYMMVIAYHFVFWSFFPILKLKAFGRGSVIRYVGMTLVIAVLVYLGLEFIPISNPANSEFKWIRVGMGYLTTIGFIHIGLSFAFSRQNPKWITRWFHETTS